MIQSLRQTKLVAPKYTQTAPSTTALTPCTSTIKDIETLISKVQDFPILWDKSCAEYKNALKKISLGEQKK